MNRKIKLSSNSQKYYDIFNKNVLEMQNKIVDLEKENNNSLKLLNFLKNYDNFLNNNCDNILSLTTNPKIEKVANNLKNSSSEKSINNFISSINKDSVFNYDLSQEIQELNTMLNNINNIMPTNNLTKHFLLSNLRIFKHLYTIYQRLLKNEINTEIHSYIKQLNLIHNQRLKQVKTLYRTIF